ncbi:MAG: hypothetical protein WKF77_26595 [Planctomycetaceae bacterium]
MVESAQADGRSQFTGSGVLGLCDLKGLVEAGFCIGEAIIRVGEQDFSTETMNLCQIENVAVDR